MSGVPRARSQAEVVTAYAGTDDMVHLRYQQRAETLCGVRARGAAQRPSFRTSGCRSCLIAALDAHKTYAEDGDQVWINLTRLPR